MMRTAALSVAIGIVALAAAVPDAGAAESCCFANDLYQGICRVNPGESETCQSTLEYLNNPMSTGKSYCGGTSVRGGWIQVDCKTGKPIIPPDKEKPESKKQTDRPGLHGNQSGFGTVNVPVSSTTTNCSGAGPVQR